MRLGITAADWLADSRQNSLLVPLGCSIDDLIGGGIQTQQILELVGQTATGKTQICLHCTLHTALVADSVTILYIDTSNAFSSKRLSEMLVKQQGTDISEEFLAFILSKIQCVKIYDAFSLLDFLDNLYKDLLELKTNFYQSLRLIVIDSLAAVISPILDGKHQILGHAIMMQIAQLMKSIAFQFHIAIIYTNYTVLQNFGKEDNKGEEKYKPALGEYWTTVPNYRLLLNFAPSTNQRYVEIIKSSNSPSGTKMLFAITNSGIDSLTSYAQ